MKPINSQPLNEAYEDRVSAAASYLIQHFKDHHPTREMLLSALHDYAHADTSRSAATHASSKLPVGFKGVPDYNGSAKTRSVFIRDVLDALKGKMKFSRKTADGRVKPPKPVKDDAYYTKILYRVQGIIGNIFPDGDPIDHLGPWMKRAGVSMQEIDRAFKKAGHKSYHKYLETTWDEMAADAIYDAENGHIDQTSPYYEVQDGKVSARSNPWKAS